MKAAKLAQQTYEIKTAHGRATEMRLIIKVEKEEIDERELIYFQEEDQHLSLKPAVISCLQETLH